MWKWLLQFHCDASTLLRIELWRQHNYCGMHLLILSPPFPPWFFSAQLKVFVDRLFIPQFKEHLRDFLVQIKVRVTLKILQPVVNFGDILSVRYGDGVK